VFPQLKLAFDAGRCPQRCVYADTMCVTHTHMDHVGGAGFYVATRQLISLPPPTLVLPAERVRAFEAFMDSMRELDGSDMPHRTVAMKPLGAAAGPSLSGEGGGEGEGEGGGGARSDDAARALVPDEAARETQTPEWCAEHRIGKTLVVRAFRTTHPVPSQGYVAYSRKEKLLDEFRDLGGAEIGERRRRGERVTRTVEVPEVAFTGDTTAEWIDRAVRGEDSVAADALRAKVLCCECTFVDDKASPEDARRYGHTHLDELVDRAGAFEKCEAVLLMHFSARYKAHQVREALRAKLPDGLREKVTPMLVGFEP
jgi:ribonuclease Z